MQESTPRRRRFWPNWTLRAFYAFTALEFISGLMTLGRNSVEHDAEFDKLIEASGASDLYDYASWLGFTSLLMVVTIMIISWRLKDKPRQQALSWLVVIIVGSLIPLFVIGLNLTAFYSLGFIRAGLILTLVALVVTRRKETA